MTSYPPASSSSVVTRFAPSPTGVLHVGSARTALFNFLFARKHGGTFILRIEDTDKERSLKEFEENIFDGLQWLRITHDKTYRQSDRTTLYHDHLEHLINRNIAYISHEEGEGKRSEVIRFRNQNRVITFHDNIRGDISVDTTDLGDFVIAKDLDTPLYHFAVVVDDFEMNVSHVIRGDDGIANTPRQILIQEALGAPRPIYTHVPLILATDRSKLSKRHGAVAVTAYREDGYLPEALVNFLALMGWNPGTEQEIFSMDELIALFSLDQIQKGGAIFNTEKLNWLNHHYIAELSPDVAFGYLLDVIPPRLKLLSGYSEKKLHALLPILQERAHTFKEMHDVLAQGEYDYLFQPPSITSGLLLWRGETDHAQTSQILSHVHDALKRIAPGAWCAEEIKRALLPLAETHGNGKVFWPLRTALSGKERSPDPFTLASLLGKEETLARTRHASQIILTEN
ncbi:MAG: glutamate--tRNA ligase [Minisyncoccota bacterium]